MKSPQTSDSRCLSRRQLLGLGGTGALGGIACYLGWPRESNGAGTRAPGFPERSTPPSTTAGSSALEKPSADGPLRREDFLPHLDTGFRLDSAASGLMLVEVSAAGEITSPSARFTSFTLLFTAPAGIAVESTIHRLSHPEMGELDIFLSPVGDGKELTRLEAVFSQRV